ncbi:MAG TPA: hypothetical protein VGG83_27085 [Trebonia sp.]|jgi:hypothetical protein
MPPTSEHEALHRIFLQDEALFARAAAHILGVVVQEPQQVTVLSSDLTTVKPLERRPDSVLMAEWLIDDPAGRYVLIIESQTDPDANKLKRWPYYIAYLHDKYECPVVLLIVCNKESTATWARQPIVIGLPDLTCMLVHPVVLGPDNVPAVTDLARAGGDVTFAVFSALTHGRSSKVSAILEALAGALKAIDRDTALTLIEITEAGLSETAGQQKWRELMTKQLIPYVSEFRRQGIEEGRAEGRAEGRVEGRAQGEAAGQARAILQILDKRGVAVDDKSRERIASCADLDILGTWLDRSLAVAQVGDLFA